MNRIKSLEQTLDSYLFATYKPTQIVIVDQSATISFRNDIEKMLQKYENLNVKITHIIQETPSLTKARNTGIDNATEDIIVFSDDDVDIKDDTLQHVLNLMSDKNTSMIGGINEGEEINHYSLSSYIFLKASFIKRHYGHVTAAMYSRFPIKCKDETLSEWAMGFFFVVRKHLIKKWDLSFDEHLQSYAYAEDLDFTYSYYKCSIKEGYKCILSNKLIVKHNASQEYRIPSKSSTYMIVLHREYLSHKHHPQIIYKLANLWSNLGFLIYKLIKKEKPIDLIKAQFFCFSHYRDILQGNFHYNEFHKK